MRLSIDTLIGLVIGTVVTVAVTWIFYKRSRIGGRIAYSMAGARLLSDDAGLLPSSIQITNSGMRIPRVTRTEVLLWNCGEATLHGHQVTSAEPLRLEIQGDSTIISAQIQRVSEPTCQVTLDTNYGSGIILVRFDYFEPRQGVRIEVLHTSHEPEIAIYGTLKGVPAGLLKNPEMILNIDGIVPYTKLPFYYHLVLFASCVLVSLAISASIFEIPKQLLSSSGRSSQAVRLAEMGTGNWFLISWAALALVGSFGIAFFLNKRVFGAPHCLSATNTTPLAEGAAAIRRHHGG